MIRLLRETQLRQLRRSHPGIVIRRHYFLVAFFFRRHIVSGEASILTWNVGRTILRTHLAAILEAGGEGVGVAEPLLDLGDIGLVGESHSAAPPYSPAQSS